MLLYDLTSVLENDIRNAVLVAKLHEFYSQRGLE